MEFGFWHNHQTDINNVPAQGNVPADLWGGHFNMSPSEGFGFRAFAAEWNLDCPSVFMLAQQMEDLMFGELT